MLYDGDAAGIKASLRGINMLLEEGMIIKVVLLPDGEDPDSFARSHTRQEILDFLSEHETDFIEFKYDLLSSTIERDPIRKAELIRDIIDTIAVIPDQIARSVYIEQCAQRLGMKEDVLFAEVARVRRKRIESGQFERRRREEAAARRAAAEDAVRAADGEDGRGYGAPAARRLWTGQCGLFRRGFGLCRQSVFGGGGRESDTAAGACRAGTDLLSAEVRRIQLDV